MPHHKSTPVPESREQHMTVSQLARRLGVTEDYLRRDLLAQPGGIPGFKIGRGPRSQWRIRLSDVTRWEESRIVSYGFASEPKVNNV
jgi:excisionase family DNA binding protein